VTAASTETGTTVASTSNTKAIAGGIGGAVAFVLVVVGAVILRKTCRKLKQKDAAKPDASAHELQRKDRPDSLKLGAGASPARAHRRHACSCCRSLGSGGTVAAVAASTAALSAGLDATLAVAKAVGKVSPLVPGRYSMRRQGGLMGYSAGYSKAVGRVCLKVSVADAQIAPLPQTYVPCGVAGRMCPTSSAW
jgi:hypothetical protein